MNHKYKFTFNINLKGIVENGLLGKIDPTDAFILEFLKSFSQIEEIKTQQLSNETYYWFSYKYLLSQIPIIRIKKDAIYRRFKRYEELGLLKAHPDNQKLGTAYYALLPLLGKVTSNFEPEEDQKTFKGVGFKTEGSVQKSEGCGAKTGGGTVSKPDYNTIKDNTINNKKEKKPIELDERSVLISQFRAKALTVELVTGNHKIRLVDWLTDRFPSSKRFLGAWYNEWLAYFVDARVKENKDPLDQHPAAYKNSLEKFITERAQAEYIKTIKPVY